MHERRKGAGAGCPHWIKMDMQKCYEIFYGPSLEQIYICPECGMRSTATLQQCPVCGTALLTPEPSEEKTKTSAQAEVTCADLEEMMEGALWLYRIIEREIMKKGELYRIIKRELERSDRHV